MKKKRIEYKTVFVGLHSDYFKNNLNSWLIAHPRTIRYRSDPGRCYAVYITMSVAAWRRFCFDCGLNFNDL